MSLIEPVARALYISLGFEADDPWDQCVERRRNTGMTEPCLSNNQLQCMEAAKAAIAAMPQLEAMQAEIDRLTASLLAIEEGMIERPIGKRYRDDGTPSKHDQCTHGMWMYESCGECIDAHIQASLVRQGK